MKALRLSIAALALLSACSLNSAAPPPTTTDGTTVSTPSATPAQQAAQIQNTINTVVVPAGFKYGCGAIFYADGVFQSMQTALLTANRISQAQIDQEKAIIATAKVTCATPPTDAASAGLALVGQASAIYLMLALPPATPPAS